jgi:hypothetical protein
VKLRSTAEPDKALKNYLESFDLIDDETGEPWRPEVLPPDSGPDEDESGRIEREAGQ